MTRIILSYLGRVLTLSAAMCILLPSVPFALDLIFEEDLQEIRGWGLNPGSRGVFDGRPEYERAILDLGYTVARIPFSPAVGLSDGSLDVAEMTAVKDRIRAATDNGSRNYSLTLYSPPAYMKAPSTVCEGITAAGGDYTYLNPAYVDELAEFWITVLKDLNDSGASGERVGLPRAISAQNEPDFSPTCAPPCEWFGCNYTLTAQGKTDYRDVVKLLRRRLDEENMQAVKIIGPETSDATGFQRLFGNDFSLLRNDTEFVSALGAFATHMYSIAGQVVSLYNDAVAQYSRERWMSAVCMINNLNHSRGGEYTDIDHAVTMVRMMGMCLVDCGMHYWLWWHGFNGAAQYSTTELIYGTGAAPQLTKRYHVLKKLWGMVRPGWHVRKLSLDGITALRSSASEQLGTFDDAYVDIFAFENELKCSTVVVAANPNDIPEFIGVNDFPNGSIKVYLTSNLLSNFNINSHEIGSTDKYYYLLPGHSVAIIEVVTVPLQAGPVPRSRPLVTRQGAAGARRPAVMYGLDGRRLPEGIGRSARGAGLVIVPGSDGVGRTMIVQLGK